MKSRKNIRGFTLIEVSIVIAVLIVLSAAAMRQQLLDIEHLKAKAQGQQMKVLRDGLQLYGERNLAAIANNTAVVGVANTRSPQVAELVALGFLPGAFNAENYYRSAYQTVLEPNPAACVMPNCGFVGLAYMTAPPRNFKGSVDGSLAGMISDEIGANGGNTNLDGANFSGRSAGWVRPNPLGNVQSLVGSIVGIGIGGGFNPGDYIRRDGTNGMLAALDMNTNDINNINNINSTGTLTATTGTFAGTVTSANAQVNTALTAATGAITNLTSTTGNIANLTSTTGNIDTLTSNNGTITNLTSTTGNINTLTSANGTITNLTSTTGNITALNGDTGTFTGNLRGNDVITTAGKSLSRAIVDAIVVDNNAVVPKPSCLPGMTPQIFLNAAVVAGTLNSPSVKPIHAIQYLAINNGASWTARMIVTTEDGNLQPQGQYGRMTAFTKCF